MKKYMRIGVSALASLALASVLCVSPSHAQNNNPAAKAQTTATRSVSGKVASVGKSSFTLTLASEKTSLSAQTQAAKSMTFQVDNNTTIEGKLQVGASADVT